MLGPQHVRQRHIQLLKQCCLRQHLRTRTSLPAPMIQRRQPWLRLSGSHVGTCVRIRRCLRSRMSMRRSWHRHGHRRRGQNVSGPQLRHHHPQQRWGLPCPPAVLLQRLTQMQAGRSATILQGAVVMGCETGAKTATASVQGTVSENETKKETEREAGTWIEKETGSEGETGRGTGIGIVSATGTGTVSQMGDRCIEMTALGILSESGAASSGMRHVAPARSSHGCMRSGLGGAVMIGNRAGARAGAALTAAISAGSTRMQMDPHTQLRLVSTSHRRLQCFERRQRALPCAQANLLVSLLRRSQ